PPRRGRGGAARPELGRSDQRPLPRPRGKVPRRARGRAQAQGDLLHPRRGLSGGGNEARPDRADRREHAGGIPRAQGCGVRQSRVEHAGGAGARWSNHRGHERGKRGSAAPGGPSAVRARRGAAALAALDRDPASAVGLSHRRAAGVRRGSPPQPGEERDGGMMIQRLVVRLAALIVIAGPLAAQIARATPAAGFEVGDPISLQVDGDTLFTKTLTVGPGPALTLPVIGVIPLAGVQRVDVETYLTQQLGRYMKSPVVHAKALVRLSILG